MNWAKRCILHDLTKAYECALRIMEYDNQCAKLQPNLERLLVVIKPEILLPEPDPQGMAHTRRAAAAALKDLLFHLRRVHTYLPDMPDPFDGSLHAAIETAHKYGRKCLVEVDQMATPKPLPEWKDYGIVETIPLAVTLKSRHEQRDAWQRRHRAAVREYLADTKPGALQRFKDALRAEGE